MADYLTSFRSARELAKQTDDRALLALEACQRGAAELLNYWQKLERSDVREKSAGDLVTSADLASEQAVSDFLVREMPEAGIVCEEGTTRSGKGLIWYLDPLDGTTNFVQRFPCFAVSLGLVEHFDDGTFRLVCGAVLNPVSGEIFWGAAGKGSYLAGNQIHVAKKDRFADAMIATGFPRRYHAELPLLLKEFALIFPNCRALRRAGSAALDLCWTAQGVFDGFWEHKLSPWDIAAGALIVQEAGGLCSDFRGGSGYLESGNIVGAAPVIHQELLRYLAQANEWPPPA
ncbi:MAG: inositol monophosphatase [Calditrichaeota bacterium]|nr:inositol monophosphatase [Calditrichota bacterium]MCB9391741.1 inositol monophosphatase [Calditrichota bacterium]